MFPIILAGIDLLKDLFIPQRSNIVWFYLDEYGNPIKQSFDFEVYETDEVVNSVSEIIISEEFQTWLRKVSSHNKIESEYCLTYMVKWDNEVSVRYFSKR